MEDGSYTAADGTEVQLPLDEMREAVGKTHVCFGQCGGPSVYAKATAAPAATTGGDDNDCSDHDASQDVDMADPDGGVGSSSNDIGSHALEQSAGCDAATCHCCCWFRRILPMLPAVCSTRFVTDPVVLSLNLCSVR